MFEFIRDNLKIEIEEQKGYYGPEGHKAVLKLTNPETGQDEEISTTYISYLGPREKGY